MWLKTKKSDNPEKVEDNIPPQPESFWEASIKYAFERSDGGDRVWACTISYYEYWLSKGYGHAQWLDTVKVRDYKQSKDYDEVKEWLDSWPAEFKAWSDFLESKEYYVRYPPLKEKE